MRIIDAALGYLESHPAWPVVPVVPSTKRPAIKTGKEHADGPHMLRSLDTALEWSQRGMLEAIGMPTGAASGTVVIDVDKKHDGEALLAELEAALGTLPRTKVAR